MRVLLCKGAVPPPALPPPNGSRQDQHIAHHFHSAYALDLVFSHFPGPSCFHRQGHRNEQKGGIWQNNHHGSRSWQTSSIYRSLKSAIPKKQNVDQSSASRMPGRVRCWTLPIHFTMGGEVEGRRVPPMDVARLLFDLVVRLLHVTLRHD